MTILFFILQIPALLHNPPSQQSLLEPHKHGLHRAPLVRPRGSPYRQQAFPEVKRQGISSPTSSLKATPIAACIGRYPYRPGFVIGIGTSQPHTSINIIRGQPLLGIANVQMEGLASTCIFSEEYCAGILHSQQSLAKGDARIIRDQPHEVLGVWGYRPIETGQLKVQLLPINKLRRLTFKQIVQLSHLSDQVSDLQQMVNDLLLLSPDVKLHQSNIKSLQIELMGYRFQGNSVERRIILGCILSLCQQMRISIYYQVQKAVKKVQINNNRKMNLYYFQPETQQEHLALLRSLNLNEKIISKQDIIFSSLLFATGWSWTFSFSIS